MIAISVQVNLKRENHTLRPEEEREGGRGAFYRATFLLQCTAKVYKYRYNCASRGKVFHISSSTYTLY